MAFFTAIDSRAEVKGSRDPLGLVPLWAKLGRKVVGNVTTASGSARGFTTTLLGYYLADALADRDGVRPLDVFLRFEQVAAYTRLYRHDDNGFRGERRARRTRAETKSPDIGTGSDHQILSDQKTYGLWGLFSMPLRASGLLRHGEARLTTEGHDLAESLYLPALRADGGRLLRQLLNLVKQDGRYHLEGHHRELGDALATLLAPRFSAAERAAFNRYLVDGGPDDRTGGEQARLAALLRSLSPSELFGFQSLSKVITGARTAGHGKLAAHLQDILYLEHVIVSLQAVFLFALSRDGKPVSSIATEISETWGDLNHVNAVGVAALRPDIQAVFADADATERLIQVAHSLSIGDYDAVVHAALKHNQFIMQERNGSDAWARIDAGKLNVRYRDETESLPPRDELPYRWRSTYFIDSLKSIINQVDA